MLPGRKSPAPRTSGRALPSIPMPPRACRLSPQVATPKLTRRDFEDAPPEEKGQGSLFDPGAMRTTPAAIEPWLSSEEPLLLPPRQPRLMDSDLKASALSPASPDTEKEGI